MWQLVQKFIAADRLVAPAVEVQQEKHTFFQSLLPLFVHDYPFPSLGPGRKPFVNQPGPFSRSPPPAPSVRRDARAAAETD
jgi:hypothetical protein